jgi:hypothetical protein
MAPDAFTQPVDFSVELLKKRSGILTGFGICQMHLAARTLTSHRRACLLIGRYLAELPRQFD